MSARRRVVDATSWRSAGDIASVTESVDCTSEELNLSRELLLEYVLVSDGTLKKVSGPASIVTTPNTLNSTMASV